MSPHAGVIAVVAYVFNNFFNLCGGEFQGAIGSVGKQAARVFKGNVAHVVGVVVFGQMQVALFAFFKRGVIAARVLVYAVRVSNNLMAVGMRLCIGYNHDLEVGANGKKNGSHGT